MSNNIGVIINDNITSTDLPQKIDEVLLQLKNSMLNMDKDTAIKLLYWLNTWGADYLANENKFLYEELIRYKRGCVVEANFGFNVGSEQGGLHYAIVLDNRNNKSNKVLMVVPLESLPDGKKPEDVNEDYEVFLGYGIFKDDILKIEKEIEKVSIKIVDRESNKLETSALKKTLSKLQKELNKLRKGSVAQIAQICALSKIRIYSPKKIGDKFSNFILNEDKMIDIEEKIMKLYLNKSIVIEKK